MALNPSACFMMDGEDLLNFSLDAEDEETNKAPSSPLDFSNPNSQDPNDCSLLFPEFEELEWLSNKDAFPALETCFEIVPLNHQSPVSVLENSASSSNSNSNSTITSCCGSLQIPISYPVRKRSSRRRRRRRGFPELTSQQCWWNQANVKKQELQPPTSLHRPRTAASSIGRRCQHCQAEKTPQWRAGPMGPKTLCNACGVRYKSGRLVPEYRPASSPTFSSVLHSNSHRKIMQMRKYRQGGGNATKEVCGYGI